MARRLDWERARERDKVRGIRPVRIPRNLNNKGPSGPQQKELARLCREVGDPWPYPKTAAHAAQLIREKRRRKASRQSR